MTVPVTTDGFDGLKCTQTYLNIADTEFARWATEPTIDILAQVYGNSALLAEDQTPRSFDFLIGTLQNLSLQFGGELPVAAENDNWNWVLFRIDNGIRTFDGQRYCGTIPANAQGASQNGGVNGGTIRMQFVNGMQIRAFAFGPKDAFGTREQINRFVLSSKPRLPVRNNLVLWLKANSGSVITDAGMVQQWLDSSGKVNHAYATVAENRPVLVENAVNGEPVLRFDGENDSLEVPHAESLSLPGDMTTYFVVRYQDFASFRTVWAKTNWNLPAPLDCYTLPGTGKVRLYRGRGETDGLQFVDTINPIPVAENIIAGFAVSNKSVDHFLNGSSNGFRDDLASAADRGKPIQIGTRDDRVTKMFGDIAEVLIYDRALSYEEHLDVHRYLSRKYAIEITEPPSVMRITEIQPATVWGRDGRQTIAISGVGFPTSGRVTLTWRGQPNYIVPPDQVKWVSSSRLNLNINTGTSSDDWTVQISSLDGATSNSFPFRVHSAPQLELSGLRFAASTATVGDTIPVTFTVKNLGASTTNSTTARVCISRDTVVSDADQTLPGGVVSVPTLASGTAIDIQAFVTFPLITLPGPCYLCVAGDWGSTNLSIVNITLLADSDASPLTATLSSPWLAAGASTSFLTVTNVSHSTMVPSVSIGEGSHWLSNTSTSSSGALESGKSRTYTLSSIANNTTVDRRARITITEAAMPSFIKEVTLNQVAGLHGAQSIRLMFDAIPNVPVNQPVTVRVRAVDSAGVTVSPAVGHDEVVLAPLGYIGSITPNRLRLTNGIGNVEIAFGLPGTGIRLQGTLAGIIGSSNPFEILRSSEAEVAVTVLVSGSDHRGLSGSRVFLTNRAGSDGREAVTDTFGLARLNFKQGAATLWANSATNLLSKPQFVNIRTDKPNQFFISVERAKHPVLLIPGMMGSWDKALGLPTLPPTVPASRSRMSIYGRHIKSNWVDLKTGLAACRT